MRQTLQYTPHTYADVWSYAWRHHIDRNGPYSHREHSSGILLSHQLHYIILYYVILFLYLYRFSFRSRTPALSMSTGYVRTVTTPCRETHRLCSSPPISLWRPWFVPQHPMQEAKQSRNVRKMTVLITKQVGPCGIVILSHCPHVYSSLHWPYPATCKIQGDRVLWFCVTKACTNYLMKFCNFLCFSSYSTCTYNS